MIIHFWFIILILYSIYYRSDYCIWISTFIPWSSNSFTFFFHQVSNLKEPNFILKRIFLHLVINIFFSLYFQFLNKIYFDIAKFLINLCQIFFICCQSTLIDLIEIFFITFLNSIMKDVFIQNSLNNNPTNETLDFLDEDNISNCWKIHFKIYCWMFIEQLLLNH